MKNSILKTPTVHLTTAATHLKKRTSQPLTEVVAEESVAVEAAEVVEVEDEVVAAEPGDHLLSSKMISDG